MKYYLDCKETNYIFAVQLKEGQIAFLTIEINIPSYAGYVIPTKIVRDGAVGSSSGS